MCCCCCWASIRNQYEKLLWQSVSVWVLRERCFLCYLWPPVIWLPLVQIRHSFQVCPQSTHIYIIYFGQNLHSFANFGFDGFPRRYLLVLCIDWAVALTIRRVAAVNVYSVLFSHFAVCALLNVSPFYSFPFLLHWYQTQFGECKMVFSSLATPTTTTTTETHFYQEQFE